jgi:hypothetical protein
VVVGNAPLLSIKRIDKGEPGIHLFIRLMHLEAISAPIDGLVAAHQDLTTGKYHIKDAPTTPYQ